MGLCISTAGGAAAAAPRKATALVLLPTGELREYPRPATAARALEDADYDSGQGWFLCDADGMGFEGPVSAVGGGEELRAGQIYFVLPAAALRLGLRREEVAALAVKASGALARAAAAGTAAGRRRRGGSVAPFLFSPPPEEDEQKEKETSAVARKTVPAPSAGTRRPRRPPHQRFASDLTAIPEMEISV